MKSTRSVSLIALLAVLALAWPARAWADSGTTSGSAQLALITTYPSRVVGIGEAVTFNLKLEPADTLQTVRLEVNDLPEGWTATFRGDGQIVRAVEVEPGTPATVELRLEQPAGVQSGDYHLTVLAKGAGARAELSIDLTVKDKLPPRLSLSAQLPTLKGTPDTTFRYSVTLKNDGDEDLDVSLVADASASFLVTFKANSQEVTSLPVAANKSQVLSVEAKALGAVASGTYPLAIHAQGGEVQADLSLQAEVAGQPELTVTAPDGRLSAQATVGQDSPLKLILQNTGSAPAYSLSLNSSEPSGWTVTFDTPQIDQIGPGQQVAVTAHVKPPEKAVAGDYVLTFRAQPAGGAAQSAEFRITVVTSTWWGLVGIALIAVAVGVVGLAVVRFGRR
ncbi:MAG: hypothetical protein IT318_17820 [Anaerolineales bacterium]|nr:hypothetical protein [Anaerolineales bacterium]